MKYIYLSCFIICLLSACVKKGDPVQNFEYDRISSESVDVKEVLYSLYLPTDMTGVFANSGKNYDPSLPAPIHNATLYTEEPQIAIMLGIYGVDISYMKLLDQTIHAGQYYRTIENLSHKLEIPSEIFDRSTRRLEQHFNNEDSLAVVIETIYRQTDEYFKTNGQDNLAALSLAGGWIEAMYLGASILQADSGNVELAERLLQQKFSLNSIYTLLSNHQESLEVKKYVLMFKKLRKIYDQVEIRYRKEGFSVDTTQKKLQASSANLVYNKETLSELILTIQLIRKQIIEPGKS